MFPAWVFLSLLSAVPRSPLEACGRVREKQLKEMGCPLSNRPSQTRPRHGGLSSQLSGDVRGCSCFSEAATSWAWLPEAKFFHDWGVEWPHGGPGLDTTMSLELWCPWLPLWTTKLGKGWVGHATALVHLDASCVVRRKTVLPPVWQSACSLASSPAPS